MTGSPEHPDVPLASPTPTPTPPAPPAPPVPAAPMPASPTQPGATMQSAAPPRPAAPPQPAASTSPAAGHPRPAALPGGMHRLHRKSPVLAGLLSLLPGGGQIYVGYYKLGFIHNFVFGATVAFLAANEDTLDALAPALGIFLAFFMVYNVVDASRRATFYNLALDGVEGIALPDVNMDVSFPIPNVGGSVAAA